jgi:hypothetical protein
MQATSGQLVIDHLFSQVFELTHNNLLCIDPTSCVGGD